MGKFEVGGAQPAVTGGRTMGKPGDSRGQPLVQGLARMTASWEIGPQTSTEGTEFGQQPGRAGRQMDPQSLQKGASLADTVISSS